MKEIISQLISLVEIQKDQTSTLVSTIEKVMDEKVYTSDNITGSRLLEIITSHQAESVSLVDSRSVDVDDRLKKIQELFYQLASVNEDRRIVCSTRISEAANSTSCSSIYQCSGQFFDVPENFNFPRVSICDAMQFWYLG